MSMLTVQEFKTGIPKSLHGNVTQEFIDNLNNLAMDPEAAEIFRDNLIQYSDVLSEGRYKLTDFVSASKFMAYKLLNKSNLEAWRLTFPDKWAYHLNRGTSDKDLQAYSSQYNKGKLVQAIATRSMAVDHVLFADVRYKAIAKQVALMECGVYSVEQKAADSLMAHLAPPPEAKLSIDVGVAQSDILSNIEAQLTKLATLQQKSIREGVTDAKSIAESYVVIEGEYEEHP